MKQLWHVTYKGELNAAPEEFRAERIWFEYGWVIFGAENPSGTGVKLDVALNRDEISSITAVDES